MPRADKEHAPVFEMTDGHLMTQGNYVHARGEAFGVLGQHKAAQKKDRTWSRDDRVVSFNHTHGPAEFCFNDKRVVFGQFESMASFRCRPLSLVPECGMSLVPAANSAFRSDRV